MVCYEEKGNMPDKKIIIRDFFDATFTGQVCDEKWSNCEKLCDIMRYYVKLCDYIRLCEIMQSYQEKIPVNYTFIFEN